MVDVYLVRDGKKRLIITFDSMAEAEEWCCDNGWIWIDENLHVWDLMIG